MNFNSAVRKVQFVGGKYLAAISSDKNLQLMCLETDNVKNFNKAAHEASIKNFAVDPLFELVATIGCDGTVIISKLKDESVLCKINKVAK